nr:hypothetical protein [Tanacetum cinerariifolium]
MTDSGHSTVLYASISSPERSWDIPDVDLCEEAALHAIEQVAPPLSPTYLPDPIELDEHIPVYVPKPEYSEYLKPPANDIFAKDQSHTNDAVPTALSLGYIADSDPEEDSKEELKEDPKEEENADYTNEHKEEDPEEEDPEEDESDDNAASKEEPLEVSSPLPQIPSPPLPVPSPPPMPSLPLPPPVPDKTHAPEQDVAAAILMLPSTTHRSEVPEADMPPQKRSCFATLTTRFEVRESLAAAAARPPKYLYGFVDTTKAEVTRRHARTLHDTDHRMMTDVELVNLRVSYEAQTRQRDGKEFHSQLRDAQREYTSIRAKIMALREAHTKSLVARIETIETRMTEMEDQFQDTRDRAVSHVMRTQALEARAQIDTIKDAGNSQEEDDGQILSKRRKLISTLVDFLDNIYGNVMSTRPKTLDVATELANDLMDQEEG